MIVKKVHRKQRRGKNSISRAYAAKVVKYIVAAREEDARALKQFEQDSHGRDLTEYVTAPEKVIATRAKNFRSDSLYDQLDQMDELITEVGTDQDLVDHWVLSWSESDSPTIEEMFEAFDILEHSLGAERCPSIRGLHGNTNNRHGHAAVLRIDVDTGETISRPHDGWDIDAAHRALALIAERFPHWAATPNHLYDVRGDRLIHCTTEMDVGEAHNPTTWVPLVRAQKPAQSAGEKLLDPQSNLYEEDTGFKSRKRVAVEEAVPILRAAKNWPDAHSQLAHLGIGLEIAKNKSGANLVIDGKNVKASISDSTSLQKLERRWGAFQPKAAGVHIANVCDRPMYPKDPQRMLYFAAKRAFRDTLAQMIGEIRSSEEGYKSSVPSVTCDPFKMTRPSFPTYEAWSANEAIPDPTSVLARTAPVCGFFVHLPSPSMPNQVAGFEARVTKKGVAYSRISDPYARPAMFDTGRRIYVNDDENASIVAALRIMAARYPDHPLQPFGPTEFLSRVAKIAAAEGISVEMPLARKALGKEVDGDQNKNHFPKPDQTSSPINTPAAVKAQRKQPDPQQEAAKAAAAARAPQWGRG